MNDNKMWKKLQNGSDIRGFAVKSDEAPVNLTNEVTKKVAGAFVIWLSKKCGKVPHELKIAIARDSRISGERLRDCFIDAFKNAGVSVLDCGMATTPSMFMICIDKSISADGSVMLTASHLPYNRNGYKFFTKDGGLEGSDIAQILEIAQYGANVVSQKHNRLKKLDYLKIYATSIREKIVAATGNEKPLSGLKIVVDAGNGVGGFYATKVLKPLGADISASQFLEPDGMFPNHIPNPENKAAMDSISQATVKANADLGIIFDTDVDRAAIVDSTGKEINKNRLIALISAILLKEYPGATIVTDSVTSNGLKDFIESKLGGKQHRFKRGYKNVINEAIRLNESGTPCPLAIETSGHAALKENYFLDDGAYLVTKFLIEAVKLKKQNKTLSDLISDLTELKDSSSLRFKLLGEDFKDYGFSVLDDFANYIKTNNFLRPVEGGFEGVRASFGENGWMLMRVSLHDPIIPLDIEADNDGDLKKVYDVMYNFLSQYDRIDKESLKALK